LKKILIIRFSSIGDIVLTTPVVRCLKQQIDNAEIHYITKKQYAPILETNPYIDKIHVITNKVSEVLPQLSRENFDLIIDLHKNFRSCGIRINLRKKSYSFKKLNLKKWLVVRTGIDLLPDVHIVDRYFEAVRNIGATNDHQGLDYFIPQDDQLNIIDLPAPFNTGFVAFVIGGKHNTKILPVEKTISIINKIDKPLILLGGEEDKDRGERIVQSCTGEVLNLCGQYNINQSASIIQMADIVITHDTGLMHIAAAFKKKIVSVWGNTIPAFGMYPYLPESDQTRSTIIEVEGLRCRPCSKLGFEKCPKGHFDCMNKINEKEITDLT